MRGPPCPLSIPDLTGSGRDSDSVESASFGTSMKVDVKILLIHTDHWFCLREVEFGDECLASDESPV